MRTPRIYIDAPVAQNATVSLPEETAHYVARVLRLRENDDLLLFNGQGGEYEASLKHVGKREVVVDVGIFRDVSRESPLNITVIQALAKGEKMDLVVQKAVELGVTEVIPVFSAHSDVRLDGERSAKRQRHWQGVARSATEQCGRTRLMQVAEPLPLTTWLQADPVALAGKRAVYLDAAAAYTPENLFTPGAGRALVVAVGPEGGWDNTEIEAMTQAGFQGVTLGPRILRTETAALAAVAAMNALCGDFRTPPG